ncbi:GNAT family N-acetyltransferase [Microvirga sp. W0021]|uniref:GNAT family N-acetyltransferase n=1 Tax=Hohaiivirga grylli TaxID=3133970 RepID=A0ABV0BJH1_9HYPH
MSETDIKVHDNQDESRLEIKADGLFAVAEYEITGDVIAFTHTLVPKEFGGRGYGTMLAAACIEKARKENLKVLPECSFIHAYMARHPETQSLAHSSVQF